MKTVAIVQARMGSSRLPGKVLQDLGGDTVLARGMARLARASTVDQVVVATTTEPGDDALARACEKRGWAVTRGSQDDVLDRYHAAARAHGATTVVRITSDCPLVEPEIVDRVVRALRASGADYAANTLDPRTFPRGLDVEAMSFAALERAWREDDKPAWREHVTPYIYRHPEKFALHAVTHDVDLSAMRWTVDTPEDLAFVRTIYGAFGHDRMTWREVLAVLADHPEWLAINADVAQKAVLG